jgi:hypothetical protein
MSRIPLAHRGAIEGCPLRDDVLDPQGYDITDPQLAVDRQVEIRQISRATVA